MTTYTGQIGDLLQVLEISRNLALNLDIQTLLHQIEQAAVQLLDCERATVFVYEKKTGELFSLVSRHLEKLRVPAESGIVGNCFNTGNLVNVANAYEDPRFNSSMDLLTGFQTCNILAAPLFGDRQNVLGVLEVVNKTGDAFNERDEFLLEILSAQCGVAIHRHTLMEEFAERKRLQRELAIAKVIQRSLLPASIPAIPGYDVAGWNQSAEETGGDFFDFHPLDKNRLILMLADVSGHGIGPALLAAECWALQRALFAWGADYQTSLARINTLLCPHIPNDRFITAFIGCLDAEANTLSYLSAGHGPVFVLRVADNRVDSLPVTGLPLGIKKDQRYEQWQTITFSPGDILIACTDGFFEWEDRPGNCFGASRVCEIVFRHAELSASAIIEHVHSELLDFAGGIRQQDDLTAVVVKRLST